MTRPLIPYTLHTSPELRQSGLLCARGMTMHRPARTNRPRTAFTLVELVTVIGLIGIISVVAAGATMSYLSEIRSRAAAARLTSDIRYAQRTALASRLRSWVAFDVPGNTYRVYLED